MSSSYRTHDWVSPGAPSTEAYLAPGASGYHAVVLPGSQTTRPAVESDMYGPGDHVVEPETRDELIDGQVVQALPALPPHGDVHSRIDYLLQASVAPGFVSSTDLLTRTSEGWNFATDACIRRAGDDPATGHRYLEELAFEIKYKQSLRELEARARQLVQRGVRRVFALCVEGDADGLIVTVGPIMEWSEPNWRTLGIDEAIVDPCLVQPLPVRALLDALEADNQVARVLIEKQNPVLAQHVAEAREQAAARGREEGLALGREEGEARGLARGREEGEARGREEGEALGREEGEARGLRQGVEALCRALGISLSTVQQAALAQMSRAQLVATSEYIASHRAWPH